MASPIRVLLVEQDKDIQMLWKSAMNPEFGMELCGWARDGRSGLEMIQEKKPDAVLMELILPNIDGMALLQKVKALPKPPVVVVASLAGNPQIIQRAIAAGADYYFVKPIRIQAVRHTLWTLCRSGTEKYAYQVLREMGASGLGMEAASAAAAELSMGRKILLKEAYEPFVRRNHSSYACVEKNIRKLVERLYKVKSPKYCAFMAGLPAGRPSNTVFLYRLSQAALAREAEEEIGSETRLHG